MAGSAAPLNPTEREVEKIEVDGCVITEGIRCDWLVRLNDATSKEEIYVELKGSDVYHAVEQLQASVERLSAGSWVNSLLLARKRRGVFV